MSKPSEPEVISRRKLFLLAGLAASFAVPASVITASNADAQQPEAQQPSAPPKKKKKKKKRRLRQAQHQRPAHRKHRRNSSYSPPAGPFLSFGMIPARAPLPAVLSRAALGH